ncbi:cilia- and flagella-associated protein 69 [Lepisosteus oculatus]|uniref:cilia- and flagella-associated protein 69 n=1 Tax=Lepisosteus oculatus TaxID=7918 RepID=UPI0035F501D4
MLASENGVRRSTGVGGASKMVSEKSGAPVVRHVITDSDLGTPEGSSMKPVELSQVIKLIEDPFASTLKERHLFVLKKVVKRYQNGFLLKDLVQIFKILNLCAEKAKDHPEYTQIMCGLFKLCSLPFLKEKSTDETNYAQIVKESISQMGYMMRVPIVEVRLQICASIISFYNPKMPKDHVEGFQPTSPAYKVQMAEKSGVAETLVLSMALLEGQPEVRLQVLRALQMLSHSSEMNCSLILKAGGASKICSQMNGHDPSGQLLFRSSEILWNLLENGCKEEVTSQLSNLDCIMALKDAFLNQLLKGFRQYDLQLRNDLLVIITVVAENPKAPIIESGFAKRLILFATFPEIKTHNPLVRNLKLSFNNEDFEMKKLFFNAIAVMSRDLSAVQLFNECKVLLALFHHIKPSEKPAALEWTAVQQEELQLQALATLATVAPLLLDDYMTCQGSTRLLLLLEWCVSEDGYFGHGNSFHGSGGKGSKKAQMRYCLRLLRTMTSLGDEMANQDLCDQGVISQLVGILKNMADATEEDDALIIEIKTDMLLILSTLCENDMHRKELFGSDGVEMTTQLLKMDPTKFHCGLGHNKLILSTVDCIWSCIVGCYTTEDLFLTKEGIFLLLDLLHSSPRNMQNVILGTLLEFCDNPKSISHINTWRGDKDLTAPVLLVRLWRTEESELGVRRDEHGRVVDAKKPLLCYYQEEEQVVPLSANRPSAAVMEVSENMRAKIYSMFCKLGFEDLPGLTTGDYVTLAIISRYLDFKVGEVWNEISRELEVERVRPVTPDKVALEMIAKSSEDMAKTVAALQTSMLEHQQQQDLLDEQQMYAEIRSNHKQQDLDVKSWEDFVAKTSNHAVLKVAKQLQEKFIESSKLKIKHQDAIFHPTQITGLQTTNFCGRLVTVDSTPTHLTGGPLAKTDLALERASIRGGALQKTKAAKELSYR